MGEVLAFLARFATGNARFDVWARRRDGQTELVGRSLTVRDAATRCGVYIVLHPHARFRFVEVSR